MSVEDKMALRMTAIDQVLGTDMKKHFSILSRFQVSCGPCWAPLPATCPYCTLSVDPVSCVMAGVLSTYCWTLHFMHIYVTFVELLLKTLGHGCHLKLHVLQLVACFVLTLITDDTTHTCLSIYPLQ